MARGELLERPGTLQVRENGGGQRGEHGHPYHRDEGAARREP